MMRIVTLQVVYMQSNLGVIDKTLKELVEQVNIKITNGLAREVDVVFQTRTPGEVDHNSRQSLIKRHIGMTVSSDTLLVRRACECVQRISHGIYTASVAHCVLRVCSVR